MLILYTRLIDRSESSSSQKQPVNSRNTTSPDQNKLDRKAHQDAIEHLNQVKTQYFLYRRFIL